MRIYALIVADQTSSFDSVSCVFATIAFIFAEKISFVFKAARKYLATKIGTL